MHPRTQATLKSHTEIAQLTLRVRRALRTTLACLAALAFSIGQPGTAAAIVYQMLPFSDGGGNQLLAGGTLTTNGALGRLLIADIVDWELPLENAAGTFSITLTPQNSSIELFRREPLLASATELFYDATIQSRTPQLLIATSGPSVSSLSYFGGEPDTNFNVRVNGVSSRNGQIGPTATTLIGTAVPEPATGLLLAGGLIALAARRRAPRV